MTRVTMPQLGESVTEGQVARWLKQPGDRVTKYEPLLEVITDKVNAEVPSPVDGVLAEINVQEGETVAVGTLICSIAAEGASTQGSSGGATPEAATAPSEGGVPSSGGQDGGAQAVAGAPPTAGGLSGTAGAGAPPTAGGTAQVAAPSTGGPGVGLGTPPAYAGSNGQSGGAAGRATPAVRRLAGEHDLDISLIRGTGHDGRVTKKDVEQFIATGGAGRQTGAPAAAPATGATAPAPSASAPPAPPAKRMVGDELIPLTPMRRSIAEHMVRSRQTSPHAWCAVEVDMTSVVKLRAAERQAFRDREGVDLTYVPFVIKATVEALREHPGVNATFTPEGILRKQAINISVAVGLDDGLIVPVIHDADRLSIAGLAHNLDDLATRARAGKLRLPDIEGGTFCVNNPGTFGSIMSAPIINQPQAGIMTMESIVKKPVVLPGDLIGIRSMMFTCLSFDHRVLDGLLAINFLKSVKRWLEAVTPETPIY
ncbi:MAG TPA: dihydrolipoamide acetyltransferase family protein [Candidatus Dormibacteraeota bacterium]|nr:dihydrolipoamide acetyltransferase family protein [Candidatus Dormibacteraeota bacterium]